MRCVIEVQTRVRGVGGGGQLYAGELALLIIKDILLHQNKVTYKYGRMNLQYMLKSEMLDMYCKYIRQYLYVTLFTN